VPTHPFEQLDPAHPRRLEIEDQTVAVGTAAGSEKFPAGREFADFQALGFEQKPERIPYSVIIIYDENHRPFLARVHACWLSWQRAALIWISRLDRNPAGPTPSLTRADGGVRGIHLNR
jgi:hypothetical protein